MRYKPVICKESDLLPGRNYDRPTRPAFATHLRKLRRLYGRHTARECVRRMIWIGIYPTS